MGLNFERNLEHQDKAVNSVIDVFENVNIIERKNMFSNFKFDKDDIKIKSNIKKIQTINEIKSDDSSFEKLINLDIKMETGTGKTYTYVKTIFKMNEIFGMNKFVIVVPTLPIKLGTEQFLNDTSTKQHFKDQFHKNIEVHVVNSQTKSKKKKKEYIPLDIVNFSKASFLDNKIHILLINRGMLNSKTMSSEYDDVSFFGSSNTPFSIIKETNPIVIIDEPHTFKKNTISYKNILKFSPQLIIRYGATFPNKDKVNKDYENLLYDLDSIKAFNNDLVKGVSVYVPHFNSMKNSKITLMNIDIDKKMKFKYITDYNEKVFVLENGDSLTKITKEFTGISINKVNKDSIELTNGIELFIKQSLNPASYDETYQEILIKKAIDEHFKKEIEYFHLPIKIKPLTLFFIDDIESYRAEKLNNPYIKNIFEKLLKEKVTNIITNENIDEEYKSYLIASIENISDTHGGYFSKDNSIKDEKIQEQIKEILTDKVKLLSYVHDNKWNTKRFIFSKWTLKEGWDNPNVFTICKLRSSGSENQKLQEVGRGLRLPVNESLFRVKDSSFELSYIVDFTEKDFAKNLVDEINSNSTSNKILEISEKELSFLSKIYNEEPDAIFEKLLSNKIINYKGTVNEGKYEDLYLLYPEMRNGLKKTKVRNANESKDFVKIRSSNYQEFQELWENLNRKMLIEYKIENEEVIKRIILEVLNASEVVENDDMIYTHQKLNTENNIAMTTDITDSYFQRYSYNKKIPYNEFLKIIIRETSINIITLHNALVEYNQNNKIEDNIFFTRKTAINIVNKYAERINDILVEKLEYTMMDVPIHPTSLTMADGTLKKVASYDLGTKYSSGIPPMKYLYDELFYDSNENEIILEEIEEVIVYGKIPRRSIRIPVIGGNTYSPDFAYIIKNKNGEKKLNIVIESKNKDKNDLFINEKDKIKLANKFFQCLNNSDINIQFHEQYEGVGITDIIRKALKE